MLIFWKSYLRGYESKQLGRKAETNFRVPRMLSLIIFPWRSSEIFGCIIPYFGFWTKNLAFFQKKCWFSSNTSGCFNKWARLVLLFWEKELVTQVRFMQNYLIYLWCAPQRHTNFKIHRKTQFRFFKMRVVILNQDPRRLFCPI